MTDSAGELRSAGLSAAGIEGDLSGMEDLTGPDDMAPEEPGAMSATPTPPAGPATPPAG